MEVARQAAQPGAPKSGPEQKARPNQQEPGDHEQFSKVIHNGNVARLGVFKKSPLQDDAGHLAVGKLRAYGSDMMFFRSGANA
jgi:hypothetical protein